MSLMGFLFRAIDLDLDSWGGGGGGLLGCVLNNFLMELSRRVEWGSCFESSIYDNPLLGRGGEGGGVKGVCSKRLPLCHQYTQ